MAIMSQKQLEEEGDKHKSEDVEELEVELEVE